MTAVLIKVLGIVMVTAILALTVGAQKPEYGFMLCLAGGTAAVMILVKTVLPQANTFISAIENNYGTVSYFFVAVKALGISYLTGFIADTCRDFGQSALAAKAELAGKCAIFILCVPPALGVLEAAAGFASV